ncbi:hypothetical protein [Streptomyces coelicoflavus]|uniref:hypothetical protein n=1 Tax=Streptomyces coelicoflavus TaxID=285562 RepID=UPI0036405418
MADEQDEWLDRETAELLLRGESLEGLESTDPATRDRAGRLVAALGALSAPPAPADGELPGEAAALAAFRKVRAERADASATASAALGRGAAPWPADAGPVRIGPRGDGTRRSRWNRPLRLGLAAALTVGMVGGVAVAAGTGVLPTPFDGTEPEPAATVSAAASPDRPSAPPSALEGATGGTDPGTTPGAPGGDTAREGGGDRDRDTGDRAADGSGGRHPDLAASCRKARAGKQLDAAHRRALKEAAGGASRVVKFCGDLLAAGGSGAGGRGDGEHGGSGGAAYEGELRKGTGDGRGDQDDQGGGKGGKNGKDDKNGKGDKGGNGEGGKKGDDGQGGRGNQDDDGDGGDDGNGDDDDADIAPPSHGHHRPHGPHAPSAHEPRPQRTPVHPSPVTHPADAA